MKKELYADLARFIRTKGVGFTPDEVKEKFLSGFGILSELVFNPETQGGWTPSTEQYRDGVRQVHDALKERFGEKDWNKGLSSIKNSLLTSFYTPSVLVDQTVKALASGGLAPSKILDPSAGVGAFVESLRQNFPQAEIMAVEKERFTAEALSVRFPGLNIKAVPFEEERSKGFDLIVSNIPFGDINVYDYDYFKEANPLKVKACTRIHNYYFVKGLDKLNEGGLLAYITTSAFLDSPGNAIFREHLMNNADFVSAIRLPDSVFKESGTQASTDLIVVRKNTAKKKLSVEEQLFVSSVEVPLANEKGEIKKVNLNSYFQATPVSVLGALVADGQYGNQTATAKSKESVENISAQVGELLTRQVNNMPIVEISKAAIVINALPEGRIAIDEKFILQDSTQSGNLIRYNKQIGRYYFEEGIRQFEHLPQIKNIEKASMIIAMRNIYKRNLNAEINNDLDTIELMREELNAYYDEFQRTYSVEDKITKKKRPATLHDESNLISLDVDKHVLFSLEEKGLDGLYIKSDIFKKRITTQEQAELTKPVNLNEALVQSLNAYNRVDIQFMADVLARHPESVLHEGLSVGLIYLELSKQPGLNAIIRPVTQEEFLSGNVVDKLEALEQNRHDFPAEFVEHLDNHILALKTVKPVTIPMELLDLNLGERWIPSKVFEEYAEHLFEVPARINYKSGSDQFIISLNTYSPKNHIDYAVTTKTGTKHTGVELLTACMNGSIPYYTYPDPEDESENPRRFPDVDANRDATQKIELMQEKFMEYMRRPGPLRDQIEGLYNRLFNSEVARNYDGSHLTFPNMQGYDARPIQRNAIWMQLQNGGGMVDHAVGAGKTLIMAATVMEMKRMGLRKKQLIIGKKANANEIARDTFLVAYPDAKVLAPTDKDFTPEKRKELFYRIMNNDWDCVVLTHDQFKMIPQDHTLAMLLIEEKIAALEEEVNASDNNGVSKRRLKSAEKRKQKIETDYKKRLDSIDKDILDMTFQQMGFDHIYVDESHVYKNLSFTTALNRIAGLGEPEGNQATDNLLVAVRGLQRLHGGDKGVTFLSGTPIDNSMAELYNIKQYLVPSWLKEKKMQTFDSWVKVFGRISSDFEITPTGEVKQRTRIREFIKLPELAQSYKRFADVVINIPVDKPEINNLTVKVKPSEEQLDYIERLIKFVKDKDGPAIGRPRLSKEEESAVVLIATGEAKKMSLDVRLVNPSAPYNPEGKIGLCCQNIAKEYQTSMEDRGVQLIFCDSSVPAEDKLNAYDEIKRVLVQEHSIPPEQIAFIHDHDTDKRKHELFKKVRLGEVRVMLGSREKMGVGVNVQDRIIGVHHIDFPWTPALMEQANGRASRQKNWLAKKIRENKVNTYTYVTERSLDAFQVMLLAIKQKFIVQVRDGSVKERKMAESDGNLQFAELFAHVTGNNAILEKAKTQGELAKLTSMYTVFEIEKSNAKNKLSMIETDLHQIEVVTKLYDQDIKARLDFEGPQGMIAKTKDENAKYPQPVIIDGVPYTDVEQIGRELINAQKNFIRSTGTIIELGSYGSFDIHLRNADRRIYLKSALTNVQYISADGIMADKPIHAGRYIQNALDTAAAKRNERLSKVEKLLADKVAYESLQEKQFDKLDKIIELREKLKQIELELEQNADKIQISGRQKKAEEVVDQNQQLIVSPDAALAIPDEVIYKSTGKKVIEILPQHILDKEAEKQKSRVATIDGVNDDISIEPANGKGNVFLNASNFN